MLGTKPLAWAPTTPSASGSSAVTPSTRCSRWVYEADLYEQESETVLCGPWLGCGTGVRHSGHTQALRRARRAALDLRQSLGDTLSGCHVDFMMSKTLTALTQT
jgi:hypothetical protein